MCGRYILVQKVETIEKRFNVVAPEGFQWEASYNIAPGQLAPVITSAHPQHLDLMTFGLTPYWAKKPMYLFNARAEGDRNKENSPDYSGAKDIINKPAFRKPIRSQRCLVIADAFIEGTTDQGLKHPYLVYLKDGVRPFAMAGIFDEWKNAETGEVLRSFSIITTPPNALLQKLPHHRMPLILEPRQEKKWLNLKTPLAEITKMMRSFPAERMNAYPISPEISNVRNNTKELIQPKGERLMPEYETRQTGEIRLQGMGRHKRS
jgi:putative SOS response-associated peptidase YedK